MAEVSSSDQNPSSGWAILGFSIILVVMLGIDLQVYLQWYQARAWPAVPGRIRHSRLVRPEGGGGPLPEILYEYEVSGKRYLGSRISVTDGASFDWHPAERYVESYPPGRQVRVYIDPADPDKAFLELRLYPETLASTAGIALLIGILWIIYWRQRRLRGEPS